MKAKINKIEELYESKDEKSILDLYSQNKKSFIQQVANCISRRDNIKLLKYLENLNLRLESDGHQILWEAVRNAKPKSTAHLIHHLIKDSKEAILCNRVIYQCSTSSEEEFLKYIKILPLVLPKVSNEHFQELAPKSHGIPTIKKEIEAIYLALTLPKNDFNSNKLKLKI